ncbi:MAG: hypothetical protein ACRCRP_00795 [Metamycoplasmataceae bacterium]
MKLVVCISFFGEAKLLEKRFKDFFYDDSINYIVSYNKRNYDEYLKTKEMDIFKKKNILIYSEIEVYWGDISILESNLLLIENANKFFPNYSHLIILDAKSIPCRNWEDIKKSIDRNNGGNWLNFNHSKPDLHKMWTMNYVFYVNLILNIDEPRKIENSLWFINKVWNEFINNIKKQNKVKYLFIKCFYNKFFLFISILKNRNNKWNKYWNLFSDKEFDNSLFDIFNIIGSNSLFEKNKLDILLNSKEKNILLNKLQNKHAPEEVFWPILYKKIFKEYKKEDSKNSFLNISNFYRRNIWFMKFKIKKIVKNNPDLLFIRRVYTEKELNRYKKLFNFN